MAAPQRALVLAQLLMALRIRVDGRVLCAAMHPAQSGDVYLNDAVHYKLSMAGVVVTEAMEQAGGRGGHALHGQWWWAHQVPDNVVLETRAERASEA